MPTEKRRILVTPDPEILASIGADYSSMDVNRALSEYSMLIERATSEVEVQLDRSEWNYIADVMNGTMTDDILYSAAFLCQELHDANMLNRTGIKWFGEDRKEADKKVKEMISKISTFNHLQVRAILISVRFFWSSNDIDHTSDEWWKVEFRTSR